MDRGDLNAGRALADKLPVLPARFRSYPMKASWVILTTLVFCGALLPQGCDRYHKFERYRAVGCIINGDTLYCGVVWERGMPPSGFRVGTKVEDIKGYLVSYPWPPTDGQILEPDGVTTVEGLKIPKNNFVTPSYFFDAVGLVDEWAPTHSSPEEERKFAAKHNWVAEYVWSQEVGARRLFLIADNLGPGNIEIVNQSGMVVARIGEQIPILVDVVPDGLAHTKGLRIVRTTLGRMTKWNAAAGQLVVFDGNWDIPAKHADITGFPRGGRLIEYESDRSIEFTLDIGVGSEFLIEEADRD